MKKWIAALLSLALTLSPAIAFAGSTTFQATAGSGTTFAVPTNGAGNYGAAYGTLCDAANLNGNSSNAYCQTVRTAGSGAATSDASSVVQLSPNGIAAGTATPAFTTMVIAGAVNSATNGLYFNPLQGNAVLSVTNGLWGEITDGTNGPAAVKATQTAATTSDKSQVVSISPNNTLVGLKDSGSTDMTNTAAHALNVSQPTAANLNVTAVPGGSAIFEVSPTTAANTASNPFFVTPANSSFFQISATNGANAKTNPIYAGIADGTNGPATVKAASTQSVAGDLSAVVQINPNQPNLTTALNVSAAPATATAWGIFTNNSTTSGQSGTLGMCATTTSAPGNTNAQTNWLSCTTGGSLRSDIASVVGTAAATAASGVLKVGVVGNAGATIDAALGSASTNGVIVQGAASMTALQVTPAANSYFAITSQPGASAAGYADQISSTPTVTASAYTANQCLGGFNPITVAGNNTQSGLLTNFQVWSKTGLVPTITVYLFEANPSSSTCTDKGTFTLNSADIAKLIGQPVSVTLVAPAGATPSTGEITFTPPRPFLAGGSGSSVKTIYYGMTTTVVTPGSASEFITKTGVVLN